MSYKRIIPVLATLTLAFSSLADERAGNNNMDDWSFGVSGGSNILGHLDREGHSIEQKNSIIAKIYADKKMSEDYSLGVSAMYQHAGRVKDTYTSGSETISVDMKYRTAAVLANAKYFIEEPGKINPYITGSLGFSVNMPKNEVHVSGGVTSTFSRRTAHIQPAAGIGFGVNYEISNSQKIFAEYQMLYSGKIKTNGTVTTGGETTNETLSNNLFQNIVTIGLEFKV